MSIHESDFDNEKELENWVKANRAKKQKFDGHPLGDAVSIGLAVIPARLASALAAIIAALAFTCVLV